MVDPHKLAYAAHLCGAGDSIVEIVAKTGVTRSSLYRHLPPRARSIRSPPQASGEAVTRPANTPRQPVL